MVAYKPELLARPDRLHDAAHLPVELERKPLHRADRGIDLPVEEIRIEGGEAREQGVERRAGGSDRRGSAREIPRTERRCDAVEARCERLGFALKRSGIELRRQRAQRVDGVAERPLRRARQERGEILQRLPDVLFERRLVHLVQRDRRRDEPQEIVEVRNLAHLRLLARHGRERLVHERDKARSIERRSRRQEIVRPLDGFEPVRARLGRGLRRRRRRRRRAAAALARRPPSASAPERDGLPLATAFTSAGLLNRSGGGAKLAFMRR